MAIDTISKQWSIKDMLAPWRGPPIPDLGPPIPGGPIPDIDQLHYLLLYTGITLAGPGTDPIVEKSLGTLGRQALSHERHSDESESGATLTVSTPKGNVRRILLVTVKYTANATVNVTITLNSGAGANYDTLIQTIALSSDTDGKYIPPAPWIISDDDVVDVFAPLLSSETSTVVIYSEIW